MKVKKGNKKLLNNTDELKSALLLTTYLISPIKDGATSIDIINNDSVDKNSTELVQKVSPDYVMPGNLDSKISEIPLTVRKTIAEEIGINYNDLTYNHLVGITSLELNSLTINDLEFLKFFPMLKSISINKCQISDTSYLKKTRLREIRFFSSSIDDKDLLSLPSTVDTLVLDFSNYVTDLSVLKEITPKLKNLTISRMTSIKKLEDIKDLDLDSFGCYECPGVTKELKDYLNKNGIVTNVSDYEIELNEELNSIISQIINVNMNEEEKISAITDYVINHIIYDSSNVQLNNQYPLTNALKGFGTCASFATLMSALLQKANMISYELVNDNHAWTLVQKDGKYYYIDSTNIVQLPFLKEFFDKYGIGFYYMQDPSATFLSAMSDYDSENIIISNEIIKEITESENEKDIIEKYFSNYFGDIITTLSLATIILCLSSIKYIKKIKNKKSL